MSRAERLLALLQLLRRHRGPVSGAQLAAELDVSLRTVYRDIESLVGQGAAIEGAAGLGFVLRPGFLLPPLMFTESEIEVLSLGAQWVVRQGDAELSAAAESALARIRTALPDHRRHDLDHVGLLAGPGRAALPGMVDLAEVRRAMRAQTKLRLGYCDKAGTVTERLVWPIGLGFFDQVRVLIAWCELRDDFRHFRADRIRTMSETELRYPKPRRMLLKLWRDREGLTGVPGAITADRS
ncbi:helix-turn-helix transcriptional regulator [Lichenifustis flavocetrariae]|uniref:YafY family transcriptional regulator n=1 Tax=Lichenifustis flavocetrariae TaxID=2949735 RepID=A0AA42CKX1_9HYPH|nr:YafY family protein [Lichenifustis flavocetrariae]MCW6511029.1 YafY family transcriptional regulator [Lichenifustis flavocetrariae]